MPLAFELDTVDSLTSRPSAQAVNQRVLHHNSELTNFVSRLTEEKMELRNTLGRLEEEIWRYRQRGAKQEDAVLGQEVKESQSGTPVMGVDLQQGYAPNSNNLSPLRINTQSRTNGSGPFNSHASSPLHSVVHQSSYSPSYLSSSFTQRDLLNGASPYHSLGGASSGYHVNSNGVTNRSSPYQSVGGVSDSYHVSGNIFVHTTLPTRNYSSKPHPTSKTSGAR